MMHPKSQTPGFLWKPGFEGSSFCNNEQLALNLIIDLLTVITKVNIVFCEQLHCLNFLKVYCPMSLTFNLQTGTNWRESGVANEMSFISWKAW